MVLSFATLAWGALRRFMGRVLVRPMARGSRILGNMLDRLCRLELRGLKRGLVRCLGMRAIRSGIGPGDCWVMGVLVLVVLDGIVMMMEIKGYINAAFYSSCRLSREFSSIRLVAPLTQIFA